MNPLLALTKVFGLFGHGRSPAALLNLSAPHWGYRVRRNIAYGAGPRQRLDIYAPVDANSAAPVVVFFYGGAFQAGRKSEYRFVGEALATRGIVVAVPDYRIYPPARFPEFVEDGAQAVAKMRATASSVGGDPARIFLAGHSAGAYIATMLAANSAFGAGPIRGAIALSGRYRFTPMRNAVVNEIFSGFSLEETRAASFITGRIPPMFVAAGSAEDAAVLDEKSRLARHLREHGNEVTEVTYPKIGHAGIVAALAPGFRRRAPVREDIVRFIQRY